MEKSLEYWDLRETYNVFSSSDKILNGINVFRIHSHMKIHESIRRAIEFQFKLFLYSFIKNKVCNIIL